MRQDPPATSTGPSAEPGAGSSSQALSPERVEAAYTEFGRDLLAFLIGVLRDRHAAQDALQQTFQRAAEAGGGARPETFRGWLFQVAYREALVVRRRRQRDERHHQKLWTALESNWSGKRPTDPLIAAEEVARLKQAVDELPVEQRHVVERRIQHEETFAEIAANLNVPLGTVLTRMRLAIEKLRKQLGDD